MTLNLDLITLFLSLPITFLCLSCLIPTLPYFLSLLLLLLLPTNVSVLVKETTKSLGSSEDEVTARKAHIRSMAFGLPVHLSQKNYHTYS